MTDQNPTQPIIDWCEVTAEVLWGLIYEPPNEHDEEEYDPEAFLGLYLNEVKEIVGQRYFIKWLRANDSFGLTDYQRLRIMRKHKS